MAWIQIDDQFDEHPKLLKVGPLAWGVWLAGLAYCNRNLTDGFIPFAKASTLADFDFMDTDGKWYSLAAVDSADDFSPMKISAPVVIDLLLEAGIWEKADGGFQIHDYEDWQKTKSQILDERAKKVAAGQAGGQASAQARAQANPKQNPTPQPQPQPTPVVSSETTIEKTKEPHVSLVEKPKRATALSDDFVVTDEMTNWAFAEQFTYADIEEQTNLFRDHFKANGKPMKDWPATWRNWMRRSRTYARGSPNGKPDYSQPQIGPKGPNAAWFAAKAKAREDHERSGRREGDSSLTKVLRGSDG